MKTQDAVCRFGTARNRGGFVLLHLRSCESNPREEAGPSAGEGGFRGREYTVPDQRWEVRYSASGWFRRCAHHSSEVVLSEPASWAARARGRAAGTPPAWTAHPNR